MEGSLCAGREVACPCAGAALVCAAVAISRCLSHTRAAVQRPIRNARLSVSPLPSPAVMTLPTGGLHHSALPLPPPVGQLRPSGAAAASASLGEARWWADLPPGGRFSPQFRDKNRRDIGKSQSMWTNSKMETPGPPAHPRRRTHARTHARMPSGGALPGSAHMSTLSAGAGSDPQPASAAGGAGHGGGRKEEGLVAPRDSPRRGLGS
jgi:hypothetical protein